MPYSLWLPHSKGDEILPFQFTKDFVNKMQAKGYHITLNTILNGDHLAMGENPYLRSLWEKDFIEAVKDLAWDL